MTVKSAVWTVGIRGKEIPPDVVLKTSPRIIGEVLNINPSANIKTEGHRTATSSANDWNGRCRFLAPLDPKNSPGLKVLPWSTLFCVCSSLKFSTANASLSVPYKIRSTWLWTLFDKFVVFVGPMLSEIWTCLFVLARDVASGSFLMLMPLEQ